MPFPAVVDLDDIAAGRGGFKIQGENAYDAAGSSVSAAGDVNGDGIDDLIVGAVFNSSGGAAYLVFGRTGGFATPVDLDRIAAGSGGFKIQGESLYDGAGYPVSAAGDINGDGIDDLIVGGDGAAYAVFGRTAGFTRVIDLAVVAAGSGGFKIQGDSGERSVSNAGDVNGDGVDDLIVGVDLDYSDGATTGAAYVVFGRTDAIRAITFAATEGHIPSDHAHRLMQLVSASIQARRTKIEGQFAIAFAQMRAVMEGREVPAAIAEAPNL